MSADVILVRIPFMGGMDAVLTPEQYAQTLVVINGYSKDKAVEAVIREARKQLQVDLNREKLLASVENL